MAKRGPKSKALDWLTHEGLVLIEGWAKRGLSVPQIASNMRIVPATLYEWKKQYPKISDALKAGKEVADYEVENAVYRAATGYTYNEVTREPLFNPITGQAILGKDGKQIVEVTRIITKQAAPNTTAAIFWLCNRNNEEWKRNANAAQIDVNVPVIFAGEEKLED